jgi:hypothetical protein
MGRPLGPTKGRRPSREIASAVLRVLGGCWRKGGTIPVMAQSEARPKKLDLLARSLGPRDVKGAEAILRPPGLPAGGPSARLSNWGGGCLAGASLWSWPVRDATERVPPGSAWVQSQ